jgi:DNA-binding MarR family transcriptional regulator
MKIDKFLAESPVFAIAKAARTVEANLNRALRGEGLGFFQGLLLVAVFFEEAGQVSPSQLAASFSTTRGNISHGLSALEARGLVKRQIDADDARVLRITMRPEGRRCAMRLMKCFNALESRIETEVGAGNVRAAIAVMAQVEELSGEVCPVR